MIDRNRTGAPASARRWLAAVLLLCLLAPLLAAATPRERVLLDTGWRFHRGDPAGVDGRLDYDVRPEITQSADGKVADARPDEAVRIEATRPVLKPWILPTGNRFIRDPKQRHARPDAAPPVGDIAFLRADFDDSHWQPVSLPHDWAIAGPFIADGPYGGMGRLPSWGIGWYRRSLDIPASDHGRRVYLDVGGAMSYATVWLNGQLVGGWPYGYNSWRVDLTPYIEFGGSNQLAIRLDNPPESARWYPGGGLYRDVHLTTTAPVHVAQWGTHVTTPEVSPQSATVHLAVTVDNTTDAPVHAQVETEFFALDANGQPQGEAVARIPAIGFDIVAGGNTKATSRARIATPRLWGPPPSQQPNLYLAVTTVRQDDRVIDRHETRFGIRDVQWDADRGVVVNGEHIVLNGVNQHHDLGALGAAFNLRAAQRQLEILRGMGVNAIRMAHNPPDPQLLELTDRMGFLVIDEVFDSWEKKKTPLDFHLVFPDWHEADLRAMLRRDRNHPSVILWSVGNEVGEQYDGEAGADIGWGLAQIVREEDPTRPTTASMNWAKADMPFPGMFDVINLNYQGEGIRQDPEFEGTERIRTPPSYPDFRATFPDKVMFGSETASALSTRGTYLFPVTPAQSAPVRDHNGGGDSATQRVSAYELYAVDFGSSADKVFATLDRHPYVAGEFVWNGFDYLGEPTPYYSARSSYSGMIDLAGFPKDRYYLYQARWRPDLPMVHILPHWNWPNRMGVVTPVHVFTSGDEAELFLNGVSQGRKKKGRHEYRLRWDAVAYQPGELRVQAYRNGKPWAQATLETTGAPAQLALEADRSRIGNDGRDLSFITLRVLDAQGRAIRNADNLVRFEVQGPAELVATDNGDPRDLTAFPSPERRAFSGLALAIVRGLPGQSGTVTVKASGDGLQAGELQLQVGQPQ
ncbi:beta-galactosidase GalB [Pseudoxanthomonas koreensis]|uniref:beta-galactosidase GalB n=1 Tax=Pseudoxanthomonas koreensis TaxID=266061 RepID=UPI0035A744FA